MQVLRTLVAAALIATGTAHASMLAIQQSSPGQVFMWTPEVMSTGSEFTPIVIGDNGARLMSAGWWQVPESGFDSAQYVSRLWEDTDPDLNRWSIGSLIFDSKVNPCYLTLFAPGTQLVFELVNLRPEYSLGGTLGFAVPLPPAVWLFLTAIIGLLVGSRKKTKE